MVFTLDLGRFAIFFLLAATISFVLLVLPSLLSPRRLFSGEKVSAYECGFEPFQVSEEIVEQHFIVVAILFIIFDLELIFIFPWAVSLTHSGDSSFILMLVFLALLGLGLIYE